MILSNLWMTLQKIEAAGHGDYIVNFAGALCFTERTLAVIEENLFNTRAVGIKMGVEFGDTVSVFCSRIEAFVKLHPSAADLYVMTINNTERNSIAYISVCENHVNLITFADINSDEYIESLIKTVKFHGIRNFLLMEFLFVKFYQHRKDMHLSIRIM